jgi:hypothetical protein
LFEARTILEDLAVIARLKRLGVRGDSVFHRDDAETSNAEIQEVTSGGAIRLCALDSCESDTANHHHRRVVRDHFRDLDQARTSFELFLREDSETTLNERGALLARLAKLIPDVADGLEAVKAFDVLHSITAEDINEIVVKHRALVNDYGAVGDSIKHEADALGARNKSLPLFLDIIVAIGRLLDQQVLFGPKPLHGEKAYEEWSAQVRSASHKIEEAKVRLEQLSAAHVWATG